jgi:hypothetical protein
MNKVLIIGGGIVAALGIAVIVGVQQVAKAKAVKDIMDVSGKSKAEAKALFKEYVKIGREMKKSGASPVDIALAINKLVESERVA